MANILKRIRKSSLSSSRHEKLLEDPQSIEDPLVEGVTLLVKYLGKCAVENDSAEEETAEAIKNIIKTAKKENSKLTRVSLTISEKSLKMTDIVSKEIIMEISIYNISYCTADPTFDHVFAFICRDSAANDLACYAFLCPKRKMAKEATLTIAQGFSLAYQTWQAVQVPANREKGVGSAVANVLVTQAVVEKQPVAANESIANAGAARSSGQSDLLLDWTDEKEKDKKTWQKVKKLDDSDSKVSQWIQFNDLESKEMDSQFERLSLRNAPMQILNQLPPNSGSLDFGAFACSPVQSEYGSSPGYGLSLTPSQLMSPVGSLYPNPFQPGSPYFNSFSSHSSPQAGSPLRGSQQSQNLPYQDNFKN